MLKKISLIQKYGISHKFIREILNFPKSLQFAALQNTPLKPSIL